MAASASTNPSATVASFLLLRALVVVVAQGASTGPAAAPQDADDVGITYVPISAPAPEDADDNGVIFAGPISAPAPVEADSCDGAISFDNPISTDSRRCDKNKRWDDQLCRTVCLTFKFHGYEFAEAAADEGHDAVPRCCCCPLGDACTRL